MCVALIQMRVTADRRKNIEDRLRQGPGGRPERRGTSPCCRRCSAAPITTSCFRPYGEPEGGEAQSGPVRPGGGAGHRHRRRHGPGAGGRAGSTTPAMSTVPTAASWPSTERPTCSTSTCRAASGSGSPTPSPRETPSPPLPPAFGTMGLCVCFDLRFEELARCMCLRGAKVIFVPAAFNMTTGPAHWELLFRQRAVDNQCFTVGVSPARDEAGLLCGLRQLHRRGPLGHGPLPGRRERRRPCTRIWTWPVWRRCGPSCPSSPPGGRTCMRCGSDERQRSSAPSAMWSGGSPPGPWPPTARSPAWPGCPGAPGWWDTPWRPAQDPAVPCHRVVDRFGGTKAAFDRLAPGTQRALLEAEGVPFRPDGTVDLGRCQWDPEGL